MLSIDKLNEIEQIEDITFKSQRILDEIQPEVNRIVDKFILTYGEKAPYLRQLKTHTYESTLRTTIRDSKNPKYAEKVQNQGRKAFVELIDEQHYEAPIVILRVEVNLYSKEIRIAMTSDFYPFMVYSTKSQIHSLEQMVKNLDLYIFTVPHDEKIMIAREEFIEKILEYKKNKRKPSLYFGKCISFQTPISNDELIDVIWEVYNNLAPVRELLKEEAKDHSEAMHFLNNFRTSFGQLTMNLYAKTYQVMIDQELKNIKTNEYKQSFSIFENDQLITTGYFIYYYREPKEVIGVIMNNRGQIYTNVRDMANTDTFDWYNKKSFYQRGKFNEHNENQFYQEKSVQELKNHGFVLDDSNAFYVGTYKRESHSFTEPVKKIQERLIVASAIFADIRGIMTFPKLGNEIPVNDENDEQEIETFSSSFDFETIMDLVEQSGFTFSLDIIRDFYLNLTSLDDKHFVILNGISGTGKTQLCKVFANAVYGLDYSEEHPYLKIIPVRPDWTDGSSLFGYYSSFEKRYMKTEFLEMLLQANNEKDMPHFVVLDEMNLARVEYYLSDYLSGVESRKPIQLHNIDEMTDVPKTIEIPHNFYLIGTINTDETTHSISDKVLDRAFVMTLSDVDFERFYESLDGKLKESLQEEWNFLLRLHEVLAQFELHFGYRTMNEILRKLYKNSLLVESLRMDQWVALDRVISEKILPKLRGDERIEGLLTQLESMFSELFNEDSDSYMHIVRMRKELERYGATQFWR